MTIRKIGKGFAVFGKTSGKKLTKVYGTRASALHREKQIQYFKNNMQYKKDHHGRSIPIRRHK